MCDILMVGDALYYICREVNIAFMIEKITAEASFDGGSLAEALKMCCGGGSTVLVLLWWCGCGLVAVEVRLWSCHGGGALLLVLRWWFCGGGDMENYGDPTVSLTLRSKLSLIKLKDANVKRWDRFYASLCDPHHRAAKYTLSGFTWAFKIVTLEQLLGLTLTCFIEYILRNFLRELNLLEDCDQMPLRLKRSGGFLAEHSLMASESFFEGAQTTPRYPSSHPGTPHIGTPMTQPGFASFSSRFPPSHHGTPYIGIPLALTPRYPPLHPRTPHIGTPMAQPGFASFSSLISRHSVYWDPFGTTRICPDAMLGGKRDTRPSKYLLSPNTCLPETTVAPKKRANNNRKTTRNDKISAFDLGKAGIDLNEPVKDSVMVTGSRATDEYLSFHNVDPTKVKRGLVFLYSCFLRVLLQPTGYSIAYDSKEEPIEEEILKEPNEEDASLDLGNEEEAFRDEGKIVMTPYFILLMDSQGFCSFTSDASNQGLCCYSFKEAKVIVSGHYDKDEAHALRYLVHSGADKTYYDLRDMYGGHVWRRILLPYKILRANFIILVIDMLYLKRCMEGSVGHMFFGLKLEKFGRLDQNWYKRQQIRVEVGDKVMLKVSSWKEVVHFGKKEMLAPRYAGPFKIIKGIGPMVDKTLHFVEEPVEIIEREVKSLKRSRIPIVKSIGT
ncbi:hypothetical protein Tco_0369545 [Tanacetum coccineum]